MSYGRSPYLIIGTCLGPGGPDVINFIEPSGSIQRGVFPYRPTDPEGKGACVYVADEAIAQFIAHLAARGTDELQKWIDLGASLNADYDDFYKNHPDPKSRKVVVSQTKWLKTKVTVKRGGKKI